MNRVDQRMASTFFFLVLLVAMSCCFHPVRGLVFQTKDAIIMEGDDISPFAA